MPSYIVTLKGTVYETYAVEADSADQARKEWADGGRLVVSEAEGMEVVEVYPR